MIHHDHGAIDDVPPVPVTGTMLRICLGPEAPMVRAACHVLSSNGPTWWDTTVRSVGDAEWVQGAPLPILVPGETSLVVLDRWKEAAKEWTLRDLPEDARIRGTLVYLVVTALAVRDHGRSISSRPAEELIPAWLDLAEAAPPPWDAVLARAALILEGDDTR